MDWLRYYLLELLVLKTSANYPLKKAEIPSSALQSSPVFGHKLLTPYYY